MARMPADKADARDRAQALINLELRRYARRLKQTAEDHISIAYDKAAAGGHPFDQEAVALGAVRAAQDAYTQGLIDAPSDSTS